MVNKFIYGYGKATVLQCHNSGDGFAAGRVVGVLLDKSNVKDHCSIFKFVLYKSCGIMIITSN